MRTVLIAATALAGVGLMGIGTAAAGQQRMVEHGPGAGAPIAPPSGPGGPMAGGQMAGGPGMRPAGMHRGPGRHWGGRRDGHWVGGMRAPGGWAAYHRPYRGYGLSSYWVAPSFLIDDWGDYGLYQPPVGYNWSRYYDDAVLIDGRGSVYDTVGGIDWNRYDLDEGQGGRMSAYGAGGDPYRQSAGAGYDYPPQDGYAGRPGYPPRDGYGQRRSNGVGGALVGGAVGGVAGGLIAGRHDKVGGALIGAGAGALAGYAIDRNAHRHDRYDRDGYDRGGYDRGGPGAGYPMPGPGYGPDRGPGPGYPPPGGPGYAPPTVIESGGGTVVTTSSVGGIASGTYVDGYYYPPATVTTVTVASAPVVTTTTEVFEDSVTYTRRAARRVYHKRVWHRPVCGCR
ncbi:MAG: RcnB family protein [Janthinobacterium lividum]